MNSAELARIRNQNIGFVFQSFNLLKRMTALENVAIPLLYAGIRRKESLKRSQAMLDLIGLGKYRDHLPNQLSGGQQQRVATLIFLINGARSVPIILAHTVQFSTYQFAFMNNSLTVEENLLFNYFFAL